MYERGIEITEQALGMEESKTSSFRDGMTRLRKLVAERVENMKNKVNIDPQVCIIDKELGVKH
jgi:hypothetical protein